MVTVALIGFVGGLVTGISPCVLPMLPIIFLAGSTTTERPVARPLLIVAGLVTSFSAIALFGATVLSALGLPDDLLLWIGLVLLVTVGVGLVVPVVGDVLARPFQRLPRVSNPDRTPFFFGLGLGTLYVPCAGPVLAAIVVAGATGDVGLRTVALTVAFAIGTALPLLFFAAAGARVAERVRAYRDRARRFRVASGVALVALAVALAVDAPAAVQTALPDYTSGIENGIAESETAQGALTPLSNEENEDLTRCTPGSQELASCGTAPSITGTQRWFNTEDGKALSLNDLRGQVVLVDFFAYSCINCKRDTPHVKAWYDAYRDAGLQVIATHSPEFAFEKDADNLQAAIADMGLEYPVAQDNNLSTWTNYRNRFWPAKYLIDAEGTVRAIKFGEGDYDGTEAKIRTLLRAARPDVDLPAPVDPATDSTSTRAGRTPATFLGWGRTANYAGEPRIDSGDRVDYLLAPGQQDDTFSLGGPWTVEAQYAVSQDDGADGEAARSRLSFSARSVFHVMGGSGVVTVSVPGKRDHTILVHDRPDAYQIYAGDGAERRVATLTYSPGVRAYTFTFG